MKRGILSLVLMGSVLTGCEGEIPGLCTSDEYFDLDTYVTNVESAVTDVAGFQVAVTQDGNLVYANAEGYSIHPSDDGPTVDMTTSTRMNVASVSKFIGAIALMQVLEEEGIGIDERIYDYLPPRWQDAMHPDFYQVGSPWVVTFEKMLRNETAIAFPKAGNGTWSPGIMPTTTQMLAGISQPAAPNRMGVYQNGNFTLTRVLISEIVFDLSEDVNDYNGATAGLYFGYIAANIFDPLQIDAPMTVGDVNDYYATDTFTHAYQYPFDASFNGANGQPGWAPTSDPTLNGGSGGLVLSSMDLAKVLAYFAHDDNETIISAAQRQSILDNELGLTGSVTGAHGRYPSKGGTRGADSDSRALRSQVIFFPNGVETVVLTNSNLSGLNTLLKNAYDNAWISDC